MGLIWLFISAPFAPPTQTEFNRSILASDRERPFRPPPVQQGGEWLQVGKDRGLLAGQSNHQREPVSRIEIGFRQESQFRELSFFVFSRYHRLARVISR